MSIEIRVPPLPESVTDATLVAWHKKPGENVSRDENLVDLETDKVVLEVPAPASGTLAEIKISDGATVTAGEVLAVLAEGAGAPAGAAPEPAAEAPSPAPDAEPPAQTAPGAAAGKFSPAVRRLLDEHDLDATVIAGTGKDGRITKSDVMNYLKSHSDEDVTPGDPAPQLSAAVPAAGGSRTEQRVPMTRLRARIAERMVEAQQTAAMLTTFNEVDLTQVISLRKRYRESFEKEHGVRLGFMSFFAKASVEALRKFPVVNASVEGNEIVYHDYYDLGIAVSSERGLMVPILRDVDRMSFATVENTIAELGRKAREGTMSMEELTGGTFTITNGGIFALTYDHRIIDGREAVQFLVSIKNTLEDPGRLLLQV